MAKLQGLFGAGRGKVGNVVLSKGPNATTVARQYQPQVKNPRSRAQLEQRAKMVMAGQLASLVPAELVRPLGMGTTLANRSEFSRIVLNHAVAEVVGDNEYRGAIEYQNILFGRGTAERLGTAGTPTVTASQITVPITITADQWDGLGLRVIALVLSNSENRIFDAVYYTDHLPSNIEDTTVTIKTNGELTDGHQVAIYTVPFSVTDRASFARGLNIYGDTTRAIANMLVGTSSMLEWGRSQFEVVVPFVPQS